MEPSVLQQGGFGHAWSQTVVYGGAFPNRGQKEFIDFLEMLDREIPAEITAIHIVLDNLRMHKGKQVQAGSPNIRASSFTILPCIVRG
jgi:hypothetical protein